MEPPVYITAQEAAERLLTIRIAGWLLFIIVVLAGMWLIVRWKYSEDRRRTEAETALLEAENAKARIQTTENLGTAMTQVLKEDSGWKVQYFALKAKYDELLKHSKNMENTLETATGANGFIPMGVADASNN